MEVGIEGWKVRKCGAVVEVAEVMECDRGVMEVTEMMEVLYRFIMECVE